MTAYGAWLLDQGHNIRIITGEESDNLAANDLLQSLARRDCDGLERRVEFAPPRTLHDVMQQMSDTTMVVATRYHNIVCALKMGKPTISLGYADKNSALMTEFGLSDFCQEISSFDVDRLKAQTERLLEGRSTFEAKIAEARGRVEADLREQEALIVSLL